MADGSNLAHPLDQNLEESRGRGRPTKRTPEIEHAILEGLRQGIPLGRLCKTRKDLPDRGTVSAWREADEEFHRKVTLARARGCDALAEESLDIADDGSNDYMEKLMADGTMRRVIDTEHVQRSKLRIDTRLKLAAVWNHAEYGAKSSVDVSGTLSLEALVLASLPKDEPLNVTPLAQSSALPANTWDDLL